MTPPSLHVLCIEDDVDTRELLGFYLRSLGLEVDLAANASEALRYSDETHFDLYVLESWLPDLEGDALCRELRQRARHPIPILFFSAAAREVDKQKGMKAGATAYITKPDFDELVDTVSDLIAKARAGQMKTLTYPTELRRLSPAC